MCKLSFILGALIVLICLSSCDGGEVRVNNTYSLFINGKKSQLVRRNANTMRHSIFPTVKDFAFNSTHLLLLQFPDSLWYRVYLSSILLNSFNNSESKQAGSNNYWPGYTSIRNDSIFSTKSISDSNSVEGQLIAREIADSLIKFDLYQRKIFSNSENYWILDLVNDSLHGPFSKKEYQFERQKLVVKSNLSSKVNKGAQHRWQLHNYSHKVEAS
jgi:hypothetical protein